MINIFFWKVGVWCTLPGMAYWFFFFCGHRKAGHRQCPLRWIEKLVKLGIERLWFKWQTRNEYRSNIFRWYTVVSCASESRHVCGARQSNERRGQNMEKAWLTTASSTAEPANAYPGQNRQIILQGRAGSSGKSRPWPWYQQNNVRTLVRSGASHRWWRPKPGSGRSNGGSLMS